MSRDWYDNYRAKIKKDAEKVKPAKEIPQHILWLKAIGSAALENEGGSSYTKTDEKFYFTEGLVNQLMTYAYNEGSKDIEKKSYDEGAYQARKSMAKFLGVDYEDCDD